MGVASLTDRILTRLLDKIPEATGGLVIVMNPFLQEYETTAERTVQLLELPQATEIVGRNTSSDLFQETSGGAVLGVALHNEREEVLGYVLLEKAGDDTPFSAQQEVVVSAVGQQTGLGILQAYARQEDDARRRLEQGRSSQGY